MNLFDAITQNGTYRPNPLPGAKLCIVEGGAGWFRGKNVAPVAWAEGWNDERATVVLKHAFAYIDRLPTSGLYITNFWEDRALDRRFTAMATLDYRIGVIGSLLKRAAARGLDTGTFGPPPLGRNGSTIPEWQAASDRLGFVQAGSRRYRARGITDNATTITPGLYFGEPNTFDRAGDEACLMEAFRVGGGKPVVVVARSRTHSGVEVPINVHRERAKLWRDAGVAGVALWGVEGVTPHDQRTAEMFLGL